MKKSQQPSTQPQPILPQPARKGWVIMLAAVLVLAGGYIAFTKFQFLWTSPPPVPVVSPTPTVRPSVAEVSPTPALSPSPLPSATQDSTIGWKSFQNVTGGFTYKYPPELTADGNNPVSVETISGFRTLYSPASFPDGCPSICGDLIDPPTLEKQFAILRQAQSCEMSASFKEDVRKNFKLFGVGIYSIIDVEKVYSPYLKICGLKILDYGSFMVDLNAYGYKDVFLSDDKVILVAISPFALSEAEILWDGLGRTKTGAGGWECDAACGEKMLIYYNQVLEAPLADPIIQIGGNRVDQILSTFQFTQ